MTSVSSLSSNTATTVHVLVIAVSHFMFNKLIILHLIQVSQ